MTETSKAFNWVDCTGHGYANFFHVKRAGAPHSDLTNPGTFAWGGWLGTASFVDPVAHCGMVYLIQRAGVDASALNDRIRSVVSSAASC